jgi:hypothetical protein
MTDLAIKKVDGLLSNAGLRPLEVVEKMWPGTELNPFSRWTSFWLSAQRAQRARSARIGFLRGQKMSDNLKVLFGAC